MPASVRSCHPRRAPSYASVKKVGQCRWRAAEMEAPPSEPPSSMKIALGKLTWVRVRVRVKCDDVCGGGQARVRVGSDP